MYLYILNFSVLICREEYTTLFKYLYHDMQGEEPLCTVD